VILATLLTLFPLAIKLFAQYFFIKNYDSSSVDIFFISLMVSHFYIYILGLYPSKLSDKIVVFNLELDKDFSYFGSMMILIIAFGFLLSIPMLFFSNNSFLGFNLGVQLSVTNSYLALYLLYLRKNDYKRFVQYSLVNIAIALITFFSALYSDIYLLVNYLMSIFLLGLIVREFFNYNSILEIIKRIVQSFQDFQYVFLMISFAFILGLEKMIAGVYLFPELKMYFWSANIMLLLSTISARYLRVESFTYQVYFFIFMLSISIFIHISEFKLNFINYQLFSDIWRDGMSAVLLLPFYMLVWLVFNELRLKSVKIYGAIYIALFSLIKALLIFLLFDFTGVILISEVSLIFVIPIAVYWAYLQSENVIYKKK
jgi:hypothetical protein